ncbi:hypothetical protein [Sorangium sp. So ce1151]|uniref:hypothetical protein n=1 Tax=Sorangium sp. So ce1151 TaxID=3133332 RepID=UPI003F6491E9
MALIAEVVDIIDSSGCLCVPVVPGDTITGTYSYDVRAADVASDDTVGDYTFTTPDTGISLDVNGVTTGTDPDNVSFLIELVNRPDSDNYLLRSFNNLPLSCGTPVDHIAWQLDDPTGAALSDTVLTKRPPDLAAFQSIFGLTITGSFATCDYLIRAEVTSVTRTH